MDHLVRDMGTVFRSPPETISCKSNTNNYPQIRPGILGLRPQLRALEGGLLLLLQLIVSGEERKTIPMAVVGACVSCIVAELMEFQPIFDEVG